MEKHETKNENINSSESIYISCNRGKGIRLTPLYVKHNTSDDDLYYKIELLERDNDSGMWTSVNKGTWNIYSSEIEKLFNFIAETTELKTRETVAILEKENDQISFIKSVLADGTINKLISSGKININEIDLLKDSIRLVEIENAIKEFENLLETSDTEKDFENWCKKNYWAFGNYYVATDDIHQISNAERVDCLIKNAINQYRDIIEFKKPSFSVLEYDSIHQNYYFAKEVSKAISQAVNYSDIFSLEASQGLHRHEEIVSYYPKSIIVIGRSKDFTKEQIRALHGLNSRLNGIVVKTYDDLLAQAKSLLKTIKSDEEFIESTNDDLPF